MAVHGNSKRSPILSTSAYVNAAHSCNAVCGSRHYSVAHVAVHVRVTSTEHAEAPRLPDGFEVGTWQQLEGAVVAVQRARAVGSSLEELYQAVETLCVHKHAAQLLSKLRAVCDVHVAAMLQELGQHVAKDGEAFLMHMSSVWQAHCSQMLLIRSIFLYLDRSFVVAQEEAAERSIFDMGLLQFRRHFEQQPQVHNAACIA